MPLTVLANAQTRLYMVFLCFQCAAGRRLAACKRLRLFECECDILWKCGTLRSAAQRAYVSPDNASYIYRNPRGPEARS